MTNTKLTWIVQIFEQYFKLCFTFHRRTLFPHECRKTKTKWTVGDSFRFDDFPIQNGGNSVEDEENIDYLRYLCGNSDCNLFQYNYRHVRRCVRTMGRVRTSHDDNANVITVHECYVDIFILQVSNNSGLTSAIYIYIYVCVCVCVCVCVYIYTHIYTHIYIYTHTYIYMYTKHVCIRAMTTMRALLPLTNVMWIFSYCRQVTTVV
jgi:hypothetical protein